MAAARPKSKRKPAPKRKKASARRTKPLSKRAQKKRCGARRPNTDPQEYCQRWALKGAERCRRHGGLQQVPEGSRPGARRSRGNLKHGLYSRAFRIVEMAEAYELAGSVAGTLTEELKLARSYLEWAVTKHQANPLGGVMVQDGAHSTRIRAYADLVMEFTDRVRSLEATQSKIRQEGKGDEARSAIVDLVKSLRTEDA